MKRRLAYIALFLTCVVPAAAGVYRASTLLLEWAWFPEFLRDHVDNLPLLIHVVGSAVFYCLAAVQILPRVRKRYPRWHRLAGRVAVFAGLAGAATATWMTLIHPDARGPVLYYGRIVFGPLWMFFLIMGVLAIRRRDISIHRDWMIRAFAVSMPAGTLIFIILPFIIVMGEISEVLDESIQSCAWIVHLAVAEYLIRRIRSRKPKTLHGEQYYENDLYVDRNADTEPSDARVRIPEL
tara:strand:+ start:1176 stop:1889 length:714 start_codon:yes stop_codon:yes gene_type:complete